jgi:hypothetical protein
LFDGDHLQSVLIRKLSAVISARHRSILVVVYKLTKQRSLVQAG